MAFAVAVRARQSAPAQESLLQSVACAVFGGACTVEKQRDLLGAFEYRLKCPNGKERLVVKETADGQYHIYNVIIKQGAKIEVAGDKCRGAEFWAFYGAAVAALRLKPL